MVTQKLQDCPRPTPRKLTRAKETLRRLTPDRLRLAAGGRGAICTLHDSGCTDQPTR
jgi:hypothetical protein